MYGSPYIMTVKSGFLFKLCIFLYENAVFEQVTKNAVRGLWARRSKINLVGAHIDVFTGEWTQKVTFPVTY